jgi:serine/threonine-protein kinase
VEEGARFCGGCGAKLAVPAPAPSAVAPTAYAGQSGPAPAAPALSAVAQTEYASSAPPLASAAPAAPAVAPTAYAAPSTGGDPMQGRVLNGRYRVERKIGSGGFGAVYEGIQLQMDRPVALKILHPHMTRDPALVARFRQEARAACNLRDAHTIITYDFDQTEDGILYLAMELLKGRSLLAELQAHGALEAPRAVFLLDQICSALAEAHARGIVHRDIKPENIFLEDRESQRDYLKVLDFGIAKIMAGDARGGGATAHLTASGQTLGTLEYMSPEQLAGGDLDGRSDIYSLGVMAYQMLTGALPFSGPPTAIITAHFQTTPPPPSRTRPGLPAAVDRVVMRCLAKERGDRYPDMSALRGELAALSQELRGVVAYAPSAAIPATQVPAGQPQPSPSAAPPGPGWAPLPRASAAIPDTRRGAKPPAPSSSGRTGLYLGLTLLVMAVIGGGGIGAYYLWMRPPEPDGHGRSADLGVVAMTTKADSGVAKLRWTTPGEKLPPEKTRAPDAGAVVLAPGAGLDLTGKSLERMVPRGSEAVVVLYPKRLFAIPGFREGFEAALTPQVRTQLRETNTRPAELEEIIAVIPRLPEGVWRGEETKPEVAVAARGVDGTKLRELLGQAGGTVGGYRGVSWREQKDGVVGVHGSDLVFIGHQSVLRAAIDAGAAGASLDEAISTMKSAVSVGPPLAYGYLKLPGALPPQLRAKLRLETPVTVESLAIGLGHAEGVWSLRAALQAGDAAGATALRGKLNQTLELLRGSPELTRAGLGFVFQRLRSEVSGRRLSLSLSLNEEDLRKLMASVAALRQGGGATMAPPVDPRLKRRLVPAKKRYPFRQLD